MFIFRYPGHSKFLDEIYERALRQVDDYFYSTTTSQYNTATPEEDDDIMEQSSTHVKFTLDFPGISPERVGVKLSADRKNVSVSVDGVTQRNLMLPPIPGLTPSDLIVKMEHGRLTLNIARHVQAATKEDEVNIPINGKQFLQE